jgi:hypothetical protein
MLATGGTEVAISTRVRRLKTPARGRRVKSDESVDVLREFVDLYSREEMLAFFEFRLGRPGGPDIEGLCRISQPKDGRSNLYYLSLGFVADMPDDAARVLVDAALSRLTGDALRSAVPGVIEVLPVTAMPAGPESYVRQADILLDDDALRDTRGTLASLLPALSAIVGFEARELVWWNGAE